MHFSCWIFFFICIVYFGTRLALFIKCNMPPSCSYYSPVRYFRTANLSAIHVTYCYSLTTDVIYKQRGSDWSHQVSPVVTTQHDQTLPFAKGVACKTRLKPVNNCCPAPRPLGQPAAVKQRRKHNRYTYSWKVAIVLPFRSLHNFRLCT